MLYSFTTKAQYQSIDSLKKVVQSQKEDTNKVNTFNAISLAYWQKDNYENAMQNAQNALSLSKTINFKKGEGDSYFWMGMAYGIKQNPEQLRYHLNALKIYEEIDNKKSMAECYEGIIANYMFQDKYAEALKYTYTLLSLKEKIADKKGIADNLSFIGIIYSRQNNESEALKNYLASLRLREQINDKEGIAQSYLTIGDVYLNQSNFSESLKKYLAALKIFEGPGIES
jgi:tetratricopeptide (TPR) repeat protein